MDLLERRLSLQTLLEELLESENVYFQPPTNINMAYPCIVYKRDSARTLFADDNPYRFSLRYQVILISTDPDQPVFQKIAELPMCTFDRHYTADDLNHDVFNIYF